MKIVSTNPFAVVVDALRKLGGVAGAFPDPGEPLRLHWRHSGTGRYARLTQIVDSGRHFRWELFTKAKRMVDRGTISIPEELSDLRCFGRGLEKWLEVGQAP